VNSTRSAYLRHAPSSTGPLRPEARRLFTACFFLDFEADGESRHLVQIERRPEPPRQDGAPTTIDACASYY